MRRSRTKILLSVAVAGFMLEWLVQPTFFIGGPMLAVAAFLFWWGLAPGQIESCISRLPPYISNPTFDVLEAISEFIEGDDAISTNRRNYFRRKIQSLNDSDVDYIKLMLISGHAHSPPSDTWGRLKKIGIVYSDYSGPKGIKPELIRLMESLLSEHKRGNNGDS